MHDASIWKVPAPVGLPDDGGPVTQAAISGTTSRGLRIGAVYTPPERRRAGYATALVGALSKRSLDERRSYCFLFTDLANPVSNSIYPKVGYRPVADFEEIDFVAEGPAGTPLRLDAAADGGSVGRG